MNKTGFFEEKEGVKKLNKVEQLLGIKLLDV
jgi:hypothetical protein